MNSTSDIEVKTMNDVQINKTTTEEVTAETQVKTEAEPKVKRGRKPAVKAEVVTAVAQAPQSESTQVSSTPSLNKIVDEAPAAASATPVVPVTGVVASQVVNAPSPASDRQRVVSFRSLAQKTGPTHMSPQRQHRSVPVQPLARKQNNQDHSRSSSQHTAVGSISGVLDTSRDGHGVLRVNMSVNEDSDAYISTAQIRRARLRPGDIIQGTVREAKDNERYRGLISIEKVNGKSLEEFLKEERPKFYKLTPVYPNDQIKLEIGDEPVSNRIIDLIAPIGKGQRSLVVSPPKAGKTTLMKDIATGVATNHPEIHIMAVLIGERPEEVTEIRRHIDRITGGVGEVAASNFDESADDQCRVAELALERAKRMVEMGKDVLILLDSITRLARAYNLSIPTSGRTLSGGYDPAALFPPKKFFGAARNFEVPGSLTIIGTALIDTGSRMDDLIYEEFKGTGNQEVHLDRRLAERRIFPSIKVGPSGTREDHRMIDSMTYQSIITLHRMLDMLDGEERTATLIDQLKRTKNNVEFLSTLKHR